MAPAAKPTYAPGDIITIDGLDYEIQPDGTLQPVLPDAPEPPPGGVLTSDVGLTHPQTFKKPPFRILPDFGTLTTQEDLNGWIYEAVVRNTIHVDATEPTNGAPVPRH